MMLDGWAATLQQEDSRGARPVENSLGRWIPDGGFGRPRSLAVYWAQRT